MASPCGVFSPLCFYKALSGASNRQMRGDAPLYLLEGVAPICSGGYTLPLCTIGEMWVMEKDNEDLVVSIHRDSLDFETSPQDNWNDSDANFR